jgi:hypothetical protein
MAISTYNELKTAIEDWGKRGDAAAKIDTFIDLAEADIWRDLRIKEMQTRATGNLSGRTLALPSDYLETRKLRLTTNPPRELTFRVPEALNISSSSGVPTDYTITEQIEFDRTPDSTYGYELLYFKRLTALSSSATTNAVLTSYPMVYLYGSLKHYFDWAQNEAQSMKYESKFERALNQANNADKKGRYPSAKSMKREGPTP